MLNLSRRDFVVSTAMAAALGLNARLAVSPAFAQKTPDPTKGSVTYKVGAAEVTALYDGIWEKPHDPAFIANASVDDVKAAMVKAGLPADFVSIPFTVLVVKNGGRTVMCDSGTGGQVQPTAGKLAANMKAAGIDPAKIDTILISHCHPDHIFGLMEKDTNKPVYPNAGGVPQLTKSSFAVLNAAFVTLSLGSSMKQKSGSLPGPSYFPFPMSLTQRWFSFPCAFEAPAPSLFILLRQFCCAVDWTCAGACAASSSTLRFAAATMDMMRIDMRPPAASFGARRPASTTTARSRAATFRSRRGDGVCVDSRTHARPCWRVSSGRGYGGG